MPRLDFRSSRIMIIMIFICALVRTRAQTWLLIVYVILHVFHKLYFVFPLRESSCELSWFKPEYRGNAFSDYKFFLLILQFSFTLTSQTLKLVDPTCLGQNLHVTSLSDDLKSPSLEKPTFMIFEVVLQVRNHHLYGPALKYTLGMHIIKVCFIITRVVQTIQNRLVVLIFPKRLNWLLVRNFVH